MWTGLIVLLQPLPGESFRLRRCQKSPAVQESRSEDAVEALEKWILPSASWINTVGANPMVQEPFLHLASHKLTTVVTAEAIRCSPNGEHWLQRPDDTLTSLWRFNRRLETFTATNQADFLPTDADTVVMNQICDLPVTPVVVPLRFVNHLAQFNIRFPGHRPLSIGRSVER